VSASRPAPAPRADFPRFVPIPTRWLDNDIYGHVNNTVFYTFFDTAINRFLIEAGVLDIQRGEVIGLVVETGCHFFRPVAFPDELEAGIRVDHLGTSSVRYTIGIFRRGEELTVASGHFVHVYVGRDDRRPTPLPDALRSVLAGILAGEAAGG
jgi:acyl-CoA thioester hydrolase